MKSSILEKLKVKRFVSQGQCPYFPEIRESMTHAFSAKKMAPAIYETLISDGFRRNGFYFYQNLCPDCGSCIPIRVDVEKFKPSKTQRRIFRKNQDVKIIRHPTIFDWEAFLLYRKYCDQRHDSAETEADYRRFLIESPVPTDMMRYYVGKKLIGLGWTDVLPNSLSSVYFAFDPDESFRSPGVFSLLKEVELCRALRKPWLHLGFWIKEHPKMSYKNQYRPCQLLIGGRWQEL
jgi:arginine-tRNA-protein transferase